MPPEEFDAWDMVWAWVFLAVPIGAAVGVGGLLEYFKRRDSR